MIYSSEEESEKKEEELSRSLEGPSLLVIQEKSLRRNTMNIKGLVNPSAYLRREFTNKVIGLSSS